MVAISLVLLAALWRLAIPQLGLPFDFTPEMAALLYFGARMERKWMWLPVVLLTSSDLLLNFFQYGYGLTPDLLYSLFWYAAMVWVGSALATRQNFTRVAGAAAGGSVSFFLLSNFGVWAAWSMYPKTLAGLITCYAAGLPFYRHRILGDLVFTALFFGLPALVHARQRERRVPAA